MDITIGTLVETTDELGGKHGAGFRVFNPKMLNRLGHWAPDVLSPIIRGYLHGHVAKIPDKDVLNGLKELEAKELSGKEAAYREAVEFIVQAWLAEQ